VAIYSGAKTARNKRTEEKLPRGGNNIVVTAIYKNEKSGGLKSRYKRVAVKNEGTTHYQEGATDEKGGKVISMV